MALNDPSAYGVDVRCISDADPFFTEISGLEVVVQDTIHVLTTDNFLGPDGVGRGYNCMRLLGMDPGRLPVMQPVLSEVIQRDDRIDAADVILTPTKTKDGAYDVQISVTGYTALGPFEFTKSVSELTAEDIAGVE